MFATEKRAAQFCAYLGAKLQRIRESAICYPLLAHEHNTLSLSLARSLARSHTPSLNRLLTHSPSLPRTLSLSLILSRSHTHSLARSLTSSRSLAHAHSLSLAHSLARSLTWQSPVHENGVRMTKVCQWGKTFVIQGFRKNIQRVLVPVRPFFTHFPNNSFRPSGFCRRVPASVAGGRRENREGRKD